MARTVADNSGARREAYGGEVELELIERGEGSAIVILHGLHGPEADSEYVDILAEEARVIAPSHPGFGRTTAPGWMDSVDDLVHFYLDLIRDLDLEDVTLLGCDLGGWIAAELAVLRPPWLQRLVLVTAFGIRVGGREDRDIADIWATSADELLDLSFHDVEKGRRFHSLEGMSIDDLKILAQNQESAVLYGWEPYLHNSKLRRRLRAIDVPTLVVWGASDKIVGPAYGRDYADSIPDAEFALIEEAGHFPQVERPEEFVKVLRGFAAS